MEQEKEKKENKIRGRGGKGVKEEEGYRMKKRRKKR
jgi:hypothetical protein